MPHSLRDVDPSGCVTALLSVLAVDVDDCTWYCLEAWEGWGVPQSGVDLRDRGSLYVCARWHQIHYANSFSFSSAVCSWSTMTWLLTAVWNVSCLFVCMWHVILTGPVFLHYFTASSFVFMFSEKQFPSAGTIKKTHRSLPILMLCCWHAQHLAHLFLFPF